MTWLGTSPSPLQGEGTGPLDKLGASRGWASDPPATLGARHLTLSLSPQPSLIEGEGTRPLTPASSSAGYLSRRERGTGMKDDTEDMREKVLRPLPASSG